VEVLEALRTALIFCPVLVTWAGLFLAGRSYKLLVDADPAAAGEPFLQLWLNGFRGTTAFTLDLVALVVAATLSAIILLSFVIHAVDARHAEESERSAARREGQVRRVATSCSLVLAEPRTDPARFLVERLEATLDAIRGTTDDFRKVGVSVSESLGHARTLVGQLESAATASARASAPVAAAIDRVNGAVGDLAEMASYQLEDLRERSIAAVGDSSSRLVRAVEQIEHRVQALLENAEAAGQTAEVRLASASANLLDLERTVTELLANLGVAVRSATDGLSAVVAEISPSIAASVSASATQLSENVDSTSRWVVGATEAVLGHSDEVLRRAENTYDRVGQSVAALLDEVRANHFSDVREAALRAIVEHSRQQSAALIDEVRRLGASIGAVIETVERAPAAVRDDGGRAPAANAVGRVGTAVLSNGVRPANAADVIEALGPQWDVPPSSGPETS
jgi:hypothetical protein